MELQPHQQRVVDEKTELDEKLSKLDQFIAESPIFKKLESEDRMLLEEQFRAMTEYSNILYNRINRF